MEERHRKFIGNISTIEIHPNEIQTRTKPSGIFAGEFFVWKIMAEEKGEIESAVAAPPPPPPSVQIPPQYDVNAKWDYCMDLGLRRVFYSTLAGSATGLLLFRSPVTRWASVAFAAGLGVGSAYSDCSHKFEGSAKSTPSVSEAPKDREQ